MPGCDLVILDCPAERPDIAMDAANLSDFILIPTRTDVFDFHSMHQTIDQPYEVVLNFVPPAGQKVEEVRGNVTLLGGNPCPVELH